MRRVGMARRVVGWGALCPVAGRWIVVSLVMGRLEVFGVVDVVSCMCVYMRRAWCGGMRLPFFCSLLFCRNAALLWTVAFICVDS